MRPLKIAPGKRARRASSSGSALEQRLVLEVHVLHGRTRALVGVVELLQRRVIVLGREELLALDAEGLGDKERLLRDLRVEREDLVQFLGREKVPEPDLAAGGGGLGIVGDKPLLDLGIHAPVHPADALHEAHRVPVDVVVDHPRSVLKVETLGEDIGGDQDADLLAGPARRVPGTRGRCSRARSAE